MGGGAFLGVDEGVAGVLVLCYVLHVETNGVERMRAGDMWGCRERKVSHDVAKAG